MLMKKDEKISKKEDKIHVSKEEKKSNDNKQETVLKQTASKECAECRELDNKYKRALADYQNLLKRTAKEKEDFFKYSSEKLITEFIPVYDNLKMSLEHTDEQIEKSSWLEGVKYVLKQFKSILEGVGVEEISTVGQKFDHNTMEAISGEGNLVIKEVKPGYKLNGKMIIPARVVLGE